MKYKARDTRVPNGPPKSFCALTQFCAGAKARFSELFRRARTEGPQLVTRQGKEQVVVLSAERAAWKFIYNEILYVYDMLFSVMLKFVDLGSQQAVVKNIRSIWSLISEEAFAESTYAMPITRDLSAGKRLALQLWIYLVAHDYNVSGFNVNSIPHGWSPT